MEWNFDNIKYNGKDLDRVQVDGVTVWEKALPYDAEVDYLECTRQQWIDTGISLYNVPSFSFELDFEPTANYDFNAIFCINSSTVNEGWMYSTGSSVFRLCGKGTQKIYASLNNRHIWKLDWTVNGFTYTLDNTTQTVNYTTTEKINTLSPLWLLHRVDYATGKLYGFKLWKENKLVMNLIPVRVGQVGYMYDKISRQLFGNAGTGDFILGNDIEFYDYLENDGVAYIDTGIIGGSNISTELMFKNVGSANRFIYGGTSNYTPVIVQSNNWFNTRYSNVGDSNVTTIVLTQVDQNDHTIRFNFNNSILWDGVEYASNLSIKNDTKPLYLFSSSGTQYTATARIYYCKIYDNGVLIRDFVPCRYAGQNGMWDKVNNKFYGNANSSGAFTVIKFYDYLENDNKAAYIDTGIKGIGKLKAEGKFLFNNLNTWGVIGGVRVGVSGRCYLFGYGNLSNMTGFVSGYLNNYALLTPNTRCLANTIYEGSVSLDDGLQSYTINDTAFNPITVVGKLNYNYNIWIYGLNYKDNYNYWTNAKIWYFKIYQNDVLVRDYKPCLYNGEAGLWDSVENKFYGNANSTGTFSVGND